MLSDQDDVSQKDHHLAALHYLRTLNEAELRRRVIIPLFEARDWQVIDSHGRREDKHGCDLLLTQPWIDGGLMSGVQVKARKDIRHGGDVEEALTQVIRALTYRQRRGDGFLPFYHVYWITSGKISISGSQAIEDRVQSDPRTSDHVVFWDGEMLIQKIREARCHHLVQSLERDRLEELATCHEESNQGVFASHFWYKLFKWHLRQSPVSREDALQAIDCALQAIRRDPNRKLYYWRTLYRNLEIWKEVFVKWGLGPQNHTDPEYLAEISKAALDLDDTHGPIILDLLSIEHEFNLLQQFQPVKYASLSILRTTRMLLRAGVSPLEPRLAEYLEIIRQELAEESGRSIDGGCSLCTGHALSCLSLAGDREPLIPVVQWLRSLKPDRYCWLRYGHSVLPGNHHALHYAASVLFGLLDYDRRDGETLAQVEDVFFNSSERDKLGYIVEWVRYRNIDRFEVCRMIFATFLHTHFAGHILRGDRKAILAAAVEHLVQRLKDEADGAQELERLYAVRENLSSFCLGMILGSQDADNLAKQVAALLRYQGYEAMTAGRGDRRELWDSNVDRTQIRVEGLLQYWETLLFLDDVAKREASTTAG